MDIIGNIKDTISRTGKSAVKKTKDLAGIARVNARIEETKELLESVYAQMGKKYCELYTKDSAAEEFVIDIATVENLSEQLEALEQEKLVLKGKVKCAECGTACDDEYAFCPYCGAKFPELTVVEVASEKEGEALPETAEDIFDDADEEIEE